MLIESFENNHIQYNHTVCSMFHKLFTMTSHTGVKVDVYPITETSIKKQKQIFINAQFLLLSEPNP